MSPSGSQLARTANIIAWDNGGGLSRDIDVLASVLCDLGWTVAINGRYVRGSGRALFARAVRRAWREAGKIVAIKGMIPPPFALNLHLEDIQGGDLRLASRNVLIPNQEWIREQTFRHLGAIDEVWAKTRLAQHLFSDLGCKVRLLGWMGIDRKLHGADASKSLNGLHIAGASISKGTELLLDVWGENPAWPLLRVLRRSHGYAGEVIPWRERAGAPNIQIIADRVDDESLKRIQNESAIHVCPSEAEGFGHVLLEGMSVEALIITTDAPPMNELVTRQSGILVQAERSEPMGLGQRYFVCRSELAKSIATAIHMSDRERNLLGRSARAWFEANNAAFRATLRGYLNCC